MTRGGFLELFHTIHGKPIPAGVIGLLSSAEKARDKVMHGKGATEKEQREALADVFDYARDLNEFVFKLSGFRPFDDLRGFKGRAQPLDKATTRWLLKGLGLTIS